MKLLITLDTEEDDSWSHQLPFRTENILFLPRFQALCERHGFRPTWLCTAPILGDPRMADALGAAVASGQAEIGVHLHPWSCPPYADSRGPDPEVPVYPHELSPEEFRAKLTHLVGLARERFGKSPLTYRAGRWGFAGPQVATLLDLGLRVDCSVTPSLSWRRHLGLPGGEGGPDFRGAPLAPYWVDPSDVRRAGDSRLLEVPATVLHAGGLFSTFPGAWRRLEALEDELPGRLLRRLGWAPLHFRPWPGRSVATLMRIATTGRRLGLPHLMLMLHSSELMPGGSPYFPDAPAVERLYAVLGELLARLEADGLEGATVTEFARAYLAEKP